jgi:phosphatidylglycerophosphate synthase
LDRSTQKDFQDSETSRLSRGGALPPSAKKALVFYAARPLENLLVQLNVNPNAISLMGLLFNTLGCVFLALGHLVGGAFLILFAGCFDFLDGRVARRTGKVSVRGAFLDSVLDRYLDGSIFISLAVFYRESFILWFVIAGLFGSLLTSYVRAKAESLGLSGQEGWIQRPERLVILGSCSFLTGLGSLYPQWSFLLWALPAGLIFLAVFSHQVALQRFLSSFRQLPGG